MGFIREMVCHEETGLRDAVGLGAALRRDVHEPEAAHQLAQTGQKLVEYEFDQNRDTTSQLRAGHGSDAA